MPSDKDLNSYNSSYFSKAHGGKPNDKLTCAFFSAIAQIRIHHIKKYIDKYRIKVTNILEYGPGPGYFAEHWIIHQPDIRYSVIESDLSCHKKLMSLGVSVLNDAFAINSDKKFDMIVMSHLLEHVSEPIKFLKNSTEHLINGGIIFIEVPCRDWKHKSVDEPHLLFFEKSSIKQLLERSGFENIQISYHGKEIEQLKREGNIYKILLKIRNRLISLGIVYPFSSVREGMEILTEPLERAMIKLSHAYSEKENPAWWIRVMAIKKSTN
jgi:SAM-dependent methyltransferase